MLPIVLLDCDGVKADFLRCALRVANEISGKNIKPEDIKNWDMFDAIGKEHQKACYDEFNKPGFCAGLHPYEGAVEGVRRLQEVASVFVVTSPMYSAPHWMWERTQWLFQHFGIKSKNVIHCSQKWLIQGDVFVDDKLEHVLEWVAHNEDGCGVIWDQPYNRSTAHLDPKALDHTYRMNSWETLIDMCKGMS